MANYQNPQELLEALKKLQMFFEQSKYKELNALLSDVESQWPGFQVRQSSKLKKFGLFPRGSEEDAWEADQDDLGKIDREWKAYRNEGLGSRG